MCSSDLWPQLKQKAWKRLFQRTQAMVKTENTPLSIYASDINQNAVEIAARNADRAGVEKLINLEQKDVKELTSPEDASTGLIVCNPPYGERIDTNVHALYAALGKMKKNDFSDWGMAIFSPDATCEKALGLTIKRRLKVKHGGKWMNILHV